MKKCASFIRNRLLICAMVFCTFGADVIAEPAVEEDKIASLVPFKDEAAQDASFVEFREKLKKAVKQQDETFVLSILPEDFQCGFETNDKKTCIKELGLDKKGHIEGMGTNFWNEMEEILALGSSVDGDRIYIPYYYLKSPETEDPLSTGIVTQQTLLRKKPSGASPTLRDVKQFEVITLQSVMPDQWRKVKTYDNLQGYLPEKHIYALGEYRAQFEKIKGEWKMQFFLAGC